jgi:hypothetical protein
MHISNIDASVKLGRKMYPSKIDIDSSHVLQRTKNEDFLRGKFISILKHAFLISVTALLMWLKKTRNKEIDYCSLSLP